MDFSEQQAKFGSLQLAEPQKKKVGGIRGALLKFLPTVASAAGTVIGGTAGSIIPGAGTAAGAVGGGAIGGGLGEFLRAKLAGEDASIGNIARETGFGAAGGIGKGIQIARGAKAADASLSAGKALITNPAKIGVRGAVEGAVSASKLPQTTEAAMQARKGIAGRVKTNAQQASQEGFGLTVGQSTGRGKVLTPGKADELQSFINDRAQLYGGIRAGKPIDQARDAQNVYNNVTKSLDETLTKIDRPLEPAEPANIIVNLLAKVTDNPAITKATTTAEKFKTKIENAKSLKDLEKIRREADDLAFTSTGAGKTSAAAQSHAVRDAIDEFITPLSDDYKAIKGDYTLARDALDATSKASKNAKGFPVPFTNGNVQIGKQAVSGTKNKAAAKIAGTATPKPTTGFRPFMGQVARASVPQAVTRGVGSAVFGTPFVGSPQPQDQAEQQIEATTPPPNTITEGVVSPEANAGAFSDPEAIQQAYLQALTAGDTKTASAILEGYKLFGQPAGKDKPLSAEASKVIATANSGLSSLSLLESMIEEGGVPKGTTVPGRGLFGGAGQALLGTAEFDAAADNVADAMVRARTGAAATKEELALYRRLLPQAFDEPEVRAQKMKTVRDYFTSIANRTGSAGSELEALVGAQ